MTNRLKALMVAALVSAAAFAGESDTGHGALACPGLVDGAAAVDEEMVQRWLVLDVDGEGLTREQVASLSPELAGDFDALDRDHNGRLTVFELHHPMGSGEAVDEPEPSGPAHAVPNAATRASSVARGVTRGTRI